MWGSVPAEPGLDTAGILEAAAAGRIDVLILLGADPLNDVADRSLARRALAAGASVIAVDPFVNESGRRPQIVLPVAAFAECSGTTTNLEGRVTVLDQKVTPPGTARTDWMLAAELASDSAVTSACSTSAPGALGRAGRALPGPLRGWTRERLAAPGAVDGIVLLPCRCTGSSRPSRSRSPAQNAYSLRLVLSRAAVRRRHAAVALAVVGRAGPHPVGPAQPGRCRRRSASSTART